MNQEKIRLAVMETGKPVEIKTVPKKIESYQKIVGGLVSVLCTIELDGTYIDIYMNDEALLDKLPFNRMFKTEYWNTDYPALAFGNCYAVGYNPETGESESLTDKQIDYLKKYYNKSDELLRNVPELTGVKGNLVIVLHRGHKLMRDYDVELIGI